MATKKTRKAAAFGAGAVILADRTVGLSIGLPKTAVRSARQVWEASLRLMPDRLTDDLQGLCMTFASLVYQEKWRAAKAIGALIIKEGGSPYFVVTVDQEDGSGCLDYYGLADIADQDTFKAMLERLCIEDEVLH